MVVLGIDCCGGGALELDVRGCCCCWGEVAIVDCWFGGCLVKLLGRFLSVLIFPRKPSGFMTASKARSFDIVWINEAVRWTALNRSSYCSFWVSSSAGFGWK